ncbi:OLC1v1030547C1 [Oldenlandia corymbosa var. corymbosa]|uniref:peptidylprolyl isomerase n=1 Tax=Oldenlandia corymbosa var. corymbosa TaxID=529605 RepID=A0AAV1CH29_OLDCO|nr:OLC1v1030547C1 [Oldenlandia corymbosa var. corymbosa]
MNTFCLGSSGATITSRYVSVSESRLPLNHGLSNSDSSVIKFSNHNPARSSDERLKLSFSSCSRREAIGLGLCFCLIESILHPPEPCLAAENSGPCEFSVGASGLAFCDKVLGTGPQAEKGQLIKAHYTGKLLDGTVFDSSYNRGKPLTFRIGVGEVIKGWDQGILGDDGIPPMSAGGKRTLKIPPELAYGVRGAGCRGGKLYYLYISLYGGIWESWT